MPRRLEPLTEPKSYVNGEWPDAVIRPGAPLAVHYMREIAVKIRDTMDERGLNAPDVAKMAGLERSTVRVVLAGNTWPDMVTLLKIEQALGITLWPAWGDTRVRELELQVADLTEKLRAERSKARKKAAAARTPRKR